MLRIKKIKFENHIIFGNQMYDFTANNKTYDTIILAGINGSKKTNLLESLKNITSNRLELEKFKSGGKIEISYDVSDFNLVDSTGNIAINELSRFITVVSNNTYNEKVCYNNDEKIRKAYFKSTKEEFKLKYGNECAYSSVNINYNPRRSVSGITSMQLDNNNNKIDNDIAFSTYQLLVDISNQDSTDMNNFVRSNPGEIPPQDLLDQRMRRFTSAFNYIFSDSIKFNGILANTKPMFKKNGIDIDISSLSSGEKQIVFRGVELLKNVNLIKERPVFIDEPEISMHPIWEDKILKYYKLMFTDLKVNKQQTQLFFATHSEHVLKEGLKDDDTLILKLNSDGTNIPFYKDGPGLHLPTITIGEIKYDIFDVYTTDFHIALYGFIQSNKVLSPNGNPINDPNVKQTDDWLYNIGAPQKNSRYHSTNYRTLPTYIRNAIDHPGQNALPDESLIKQSIDYMLTII